LTLRNKVVEDKRSSFNFKSFIKFNSFIDPSNKLDERSNVTKSERVPRVTCISPVRGLAPRSRKIRRNLHYMLFNVGSRYSTLKTKEKGRENKNRNKQNA